jgi:hypothetical protein
VQLGQAHGITPVGFDAHTWHARNQRGGDNGARLAQLCQLVVDLIATGACFIAKVQHLAIRAQLMEQLGDGRWRIGDFSKVNRFRAQTARDGNGDGVFVNIKAHVNIVKLFHDLPPELWHWVDKGFAPHQLNPRLSGGQVIHHVYKDNNSRLADTNRGHSNFIGLDQ